MSLRSLHFSLWSRIDRLYSQETYFLRQKCYVFIILTGAWLLTELVVLGFNLVSSAQPSAPTALFFNLTALTFGVIVIFMSLSGRYRAAANLACIALFIGVTAFSVIRMDSFRHFGINPVHILYALVLAFSSFFANRKVHFLIIIPFLIFHTVLIILGSSSVRPEAMGQFFSYSVNSSSALIGLIVFLYFSSDLISKAMERADSEVRKNREFTSTLEEKVDSRTHDLALALRELELSNDELTRTRNSLWGEMKITKKLQTLLIPQNPLVDGYQTAAYIKPASDVGGDYYDVINQKDGDWIVIGDVSGHGVPAGLVMMMVHTSIHSVLASQKETTPAKVLSKVNDVVAEYMNRIDRSKYMTITLMKHLGNGSFLHSGLHLPLLVYRRERNTVDEIDTCGTWLGLNFGIGTDFQDLSLTLDKGDILLLYTDGITESWITHETEGMEEAALHFFGQDSLARILLEERDNTAEGIRTRIIDELSIYDQRDDVTFMVLKRIS